jgi:riboflavin kinase/FMN adenylyltransferase
VVVHGAQRGRELGYPTANLSPNIAGYIPADGVYAAWLSVDGERYGSAVSIGNNPTFEGIPDKQVEAHVLDQHLDLYDKVVDVSFVEYIRPMNKFDGVEALVAQMHADEKVIRGILGYPPAAGKP